LWVGVFFVGGGGLAAGGRERWREGEKEIERVCVLIAYYY
jgi:hypothetical protein